MKGESDRFSVWPTGQHHHGAKGRTVVDMAVDMTMGAGAGQGMFSSQTFFALR